MFNLFSDSDICPVSLFRLYRSKLNEKRTDLWQRPKKKVQFEDPVWLDGAVLGHDPLNDIMKTISENAALIQICTNHSIRSTCLTKLDHSNVAVRFIQGVSGHKSEASIRSYSRVIPPAKKHEMFEILNMEKSSQPPAKINKTPTVSTPPTDNYETDNGNVNEPNQILPNIDFMDFVPFENNSDDFDLAKIIQNFEKENNSDVQVAIAPISNTNAKKVNLQAVIPNPNQANPPANNFHNITNSTKMQNYPILLKMIFPSSNVTINYNFS